MEEKLRKVGITIVGDVPWGTHFCQFYQTKQDLIDILVPYFKAGLENNEFCMWVTSEPLNSEDAKRALKKEVKNLDDYIKTGQIEILDYTQWYTKGGDFDSDKVLQGWVEKEKQALKKGFDGLRLTGNTFWLEKKDWENFKNYEAAINSVIGKYRMLAVCTYSLDKCTASEIADVISNHQFALIKREGKWEIIESAEHKKATEAQQESEARYQAIVQDQTELICRFLPDKTLTFVNGAYCRYFGKEPQELVGHKFMPLIPKGDQEKIEKHFSSLSPENPMGIHEHRVIAPDGEIHWQEWTNRAIFDGQSNLLEFQSVGQDITERKNRESQQNLTRKILMILNEKSERRELVQYILELIKKYTGFAAVGIRLQEKDDFPFFVVNGFSDDFVKTENYLCARNKNGDLIYDSQGKPFLECMCGNIIAGCAEATSPFFTEDGSFWTNSTTKLLESPEIHTLQIPTRNRCNQEGYESVALIPLRSGKKIVGLLQLNDTRPDCFNPEIIRFFEGIGASIGLAMARIGAEEEMENQAKFPSENPNPVFRVAKNGLLLFANDASSSILAEWNCQEGKMVPSYWCQVVSEAFASGSKKRVETKHLDRTFSFEIAPVFEADYANLYGQDITELKQTEKELRQAHSELEQRVKERTSELDKANKQFRQKIGELTRSEEELRKAELRYRTVADFTYDWEYWENVDGFLQYVSPSCERITGYKADEFIAKPQLLQEIILPKDKDIWDTHNHKATVKKKLREVQFRICRRDGQIRWIEHACQPVSDSEGKFLGFRASNRDITERKQAEEALRESEVVLRESENHLLEAQRIAHLGNWNWNIVENMLWWSDEVYRIFGLFPQQFNATYEAFLSYVHPDDRQYVIESVDNALREGKTYNIDHRIIRPDGNERIVNEKAEVTYDSNHDPIKMVGTVHDITEQKKTEEEIRENQRILRTLAAELQLAEERQRRQIAQDLHDSIGQILSFLTRELKSLKKNDPERLDKSIDEVLKQLDSAVQQVRTLSFDLSPSLLYDLGFEVAVEDLVDRITKERKILGYFENCQSPKPLTDDVKVLLYRSVRELLINAAKHANASFMKVSLLRSSSDIYIKVEDDGQGFDVSIIDSSSRKAKGFGIFSVRERLGYIGGHLKIESAKGKGTKATLIAPLDLEREDE